jgi:hypothetical protein
MSIRWALAMSLLCAACSSREHPPDTTQKATAPEVKSMSFYAFSAAPLGQTEAVSLAKYKGQVLLVANTASHCGYTPQYTPLGEVDRKYGARGLKVVGFVSDDFGHQAGTVT